MSLAEMLRPKKPMEIDQSDGKTEGKRLSEEDPSGSPSKRRQGGATAPPAKGRGRGKSRDATSSRRDQSLLKAMSELTLRHEDSINSLQADLSFVSYLETPGHSSVSVIPTLVEIKEEHQRGTDPRPLRQKLFLSFMDYFAKQIQKAAADKDLVQAGAKDGLIKVEGSSQVHFLYQKWDSEKNVITVDVSTPPLHIKDLLSIIKDVAAQSEQQGVINRFMLSRAITKDMSGGPVRAQIQISQFSEPALRNHLLKLVGSTAWTFVGANFRGGDVRRSPLAVQVERLSRREASSSA